MRKLKFGFVSFLALFAIVLTSCGLGHNYSLMFKTTFISLEVGDKPTPISYVVDSSALSFDDTIIWSSQNEKVATVSKDGLVKAVGEGKTKVVGTLKAKSSVKAYCDVDVTDNTILKVSLNSSKQKIQKGHSYQLNANVANYTSTNEVIWSGSTSTISVENGLVSVSKNATIGEKAIIKATSKEDNNKFATCEINVIEESTNKFAYTLMYYVSASTLECDKGMKNGLISGDILEILSVKNIPENVKIIIETGGTSHWYLSNKALIDALSISSLFLQRWEVVPAQAYYVVDPYLEKQVVCYNKLKLVSTLNSNAIATEQSLESFLKWGLSQYCADQMGLILSGHGGGVDGCLYDSNYSLSNLNTEEIATACKNALDSSNIDKFTWIGYDCCVMAGLDNASMMANYFEYMVGSQDLEAGTGYDHDAYLNEIVKDQEINPISLLNVLAKSFVNQYHNNCPFKEEKETVYCYQTSAVIDLSKIGKAVTLFNDFSKKIQYRDVVSAYKYSSSNTLGDKEYGLVDANNFLSIYSNQKNNLDVNAVKTSISDAVIANYYCDYFKTGLCGLNLFVPSSLTSKDTVQVMRENYTGNQTKLTTWQDMCLRNGSFSSDPVIHSGLLWY